MGEAKIIDIKYQELPEGVSSVEKVRLKTEPKEYASGIKIMEGIAYREARKKLADADKKRLERLRAAEQKRIQQEAYSEIGRMKNKIKYVLSKQGVINIEGCLAWAFGPLWNQIPMNSWWMAWNQLHREFKLDPMDGEEDTFIRIGRAYVAFMNKYFNGSQFPVLRRDHGLIPD